MPGGRDEVDVPAPGHPPGEHDVLCEHRRELAFATAPSLELARYDPDLDVVGHVDL